MQPQGKNARAQAGVLADRTSERRGASHGLYPKTATSRWPPFTCTQFHVLLNSLFKVLFNFPSRYLFAIGLGVVFSLTRSLPRTLGCTPKQPDSREKVSEKGQPPYGPITLYGQWPLSSWTLTGRPFLEKTLPNATFHEAKMTCGSAMPCSRFIRHY